MTDLSNRSLAIIAGVAIVISLTGFLIAGKPTIFGLASGSANVSFSIGEVLSVSTSGSIAFGNGRVNSTASSAILDSSLGNLYNWTQVSGIASPAERLAPLVFDSNRNVTVLFGGASTGGYYSDTWEYNGVNWTQITTAHAPAARADHGMVYDSKRNVVVLFGGINASDYTFNDTWEYNGTDWYQVNTAHTPPAVYLMGLSYDSSRNVTVMFGGLNFGGPIFYNNTWEYNGVDWTNVTVPGPSVRATLMTFDANRNVTVLYGGTDNTQWFQDTWEYDGTAWTNKNLYGFPRAAAYLAYDSARKSVIMVEGLNNTGGTFYDYNDSWEYFGNDWVHIDVSLAPIPRLGGAAYDSKRDKIVLFGGSTDAATTFYNDTWELNFMSPGFDVNGTWSFNPQFFYITNDGTVNDSVNITADKDASSLLGGTSPSYQIKSVATKAGACAGTLQTSYIDVTTANQNICSLLQYDSSANQFKSAIKLGIPSDAAAGSRSSVITFSVTKV